MMADLIDEISVVECGPGNGGHALKHLLVGFAERDLADAVGDDQPQVTPVANTQQHPSFFTRWRSRRYPRPTALHKRARGLFEGAQHLVGLDARMSGHRGIE